MRNNNTFTDGSIGNHYFLGLPTTDLELGDGPTKPSHHRITPASFAEVQEASMLDLFVIGGRGLLEVGGRQVEAARQQRSFALLGHSQTAGFATDIAETAVKVIEPAAGAKLVKTKLSFTHADDVEWPIDEQRPPFYPGSDPTIPTVKFAPVDAPTVQSLKPVPPPGTVNP